MSASSTSSWSDKSEQKVFKCSAKAATKHPFSILMIGNTNWSTQLTEALVEYHENNHISKIQVHKAQSVKSALSTLSNVYADLVIILLDISKNDCLVDVEVNLLALEPALLCGRTILVNPINSVKRKDMGVSYENIDNLKRKYNLLIIHGNIENYISRMFLARRIMVYSYKINKNGLPNILEFNSVDM
ncbi:uncharacterized protein LOC132944355 [Metopolophium dirhodum]|uniref:uncharacterized protein LOC132944355 n=1 Tax=Metopolophium dirhodum TaxID=44670 RepID=UPI0029900CE8|nr:uncharacterized protein LOC132944355 [Metopolophium dirhodum]XP_060869638.1 uncharacterized protein LOC132944355 [Metopolophium dirhodum]XP_060869639.1 uncharacterized protein LOC132944355 [Metopolophium dirhodum]